MYHKFDELGILKLLQLSYMTCLIMHAVFLCNVLLQSYAKNMPDWVLAKYFDPEAERHRRLIHNYQQTEISKMRSMENTKLVI